MDLWNNVHSFENGTNNFYEKLEEQYCSQQNQNKIHETESMLIRNLIRPKIVNYQFSIVNLTVKHENWRVGVENHFAGNAWVKKACKKSAFVRV